MSGAATVNGTRYRFSYGEADGPRQTIEATWTGDPEMTYDLVGVYPSGIPMHAIHMWQPVEHVVIDGVPLGGPATIRLDCVHDEEAIA